MQRGFTIIELLVVITIIVVLLSLLTPALDRALYMADLAMCGANEQAIAKSAIVYANSFKRRYPTNPIIENAEDASPNSFFGQADPFNEEEGDPNSVIPIIRDYIAINKMFNDPLTETVDYEDPDSVAQRRIPYDLFFGWEYSGSLGGAGMKKLGDKWTFNTQDGLTRRFDILVTDHDLIEAAPAVWSAHPDHDGVLSNEAWQNVGWTGLEDPGTTSGDGSSYTDHILSLWVTFSTQARGPIDINTAYSDGSVSRIENVLFNESDPTTPEFGSRVINVSESNKTDEGEYPMDYLNVPLP